MNIGNAYRRARNALCSEEPYFTVTVQVDNIEANAFYRIIVIFMQCEKHLVTMILGY